MTILAEGVPVQVPCPQNHGFKLRPEDLDGAMTPRARWLLLNAQQAQNTGCPSSISQAAAVAALRGPQDFMAERAASFQLRRDTIIALLEAIAGLTGFRPQGAFYLYVGCAGLIGRRRPAGRVLADDEDVVIYLLEEAHVAVVQGAAYGLSPYFRISIATGLPVLQEACTRIQRACAALA